MTSVPPNPSNPDTTALDTDALLLQLRRKQGTWVEWGYACQALQKSGMNPQVIFEATGFEPTHQNQVIVAAQVYDSMVAMGLAEATQEHFQHKGSDLLYEMRILSQTDRTKVGEFALAVGLDADSIKDVAKAVKEFSYLTTLPEGFSDHPGDAVAFHYWKLARQQQDLQVRSRLIAQGLRFAHTATARQHVEKLLLDFTVVKAKAAPTLPLYRLETDNELPQILPVAGELPLTAADIQAVPLTLPIEPFSMVTFSGTGAWIALPGWQVLLQAEDPIAVVGSTQDLPNLPAGSKEEPVLIVIDRAQHDWNASSYFLVEQGDSVQIAWFEVAPATRLLGRVILIMRPKRILDEDYTRELWQIDE